MKSYQLKISGAELLRLDKARELQIAAYRSSYFKEHGHFPRASDPQTIRDFARIDFVNGTVRPFCFSTRTLATWIKLFGTTDSFSLEVVDKSSEKNYLDTIRHGYEDFSVAGEIVVRHDVSSRITLYSHEKPRYERNEIPRDELGKPIRVVAEGDHFIVDFDETHAAELADLKKEVSKQKKQLALRRAWGDARQTEKTTLHNLRQAAKSAHEAKQVLASMTLKEATKFARRCLQAKRMLRSALENLMKQPDWLLPTYTHEVFQWDDKAGDHVTQNITVDTVAEFKTLVSVYEAALKTKDEYKPTMRFPDWIYSSARHQDMKPIEYAKKSGITALPTYGPKYQKLCEVFKESERRLQDWLTARFREWLEVEKLPIDLAGTWHRYSREIHAYSYARKTVRAWPKEKERLSLLYIEARKLRMLIPFKP